MNNLILIAEDETILSKTLKDEFELAGFRVILAFNGNETLEQMKSKTAKPDLVLLDLMMPTLNGFRVLEEIQKDRVHNLKNIPVVVLSNLGQDAEIKEALKLGVADYFIKSKHPISDVVEKVKELLEKGSDHK